MKPLLRIDTSDPVVAGKLIDFLNGLDVGNPELTLITIDPLSTEQDHQHTLATIRKRLAAGGYIEPIEAKPCQT